MNCLFNQKSKAIKLIYYLLISSLLAILLGSISFFFMDFMYYVLLFLFYLALFLLGILFMLPNSYYIPFIYLLILSSDTICRVVIETDKTVNEMLFLFLKLYLLEIAVLALIKIIMAAINFQLTWKQIWIDIVICLFVPGIVFHIYTIIIRQIFAF